MGNEIEQNLRFLRLRFIGKIIAGFTHEIKNYIAIIKESAGLIGDMIKLGKLSKSESSEYLEIIHSIEDQIEKTNDLFRYLNRLAHRMDTELSTFNVNESLEELIALLNRYANQKKITLEKEFHENLPTIHSNPSMLQFLVFTFLEEKIAKLDKNSRIIIQTSKENNSVAIRIVPKGNVLEGGQGLFPYEIKDYVIKQLGGNIIAQGKGEETVITLPVATI